MSRSQTFAAIAVVTAVIILGGYLGGYLSEDNPALQSAGEVSEPQPSESRAASVDAILPVADEAPAGSN